MAVTVEFINYINHTNYKFSWQIFMGKITISMVIFYSYVNAYKRVAIDSMVIITIEHGHSMELVL